MFPSKFSSIQFFQKKREVLLYKASSGIRKYFIKIILSKDPSTLEALYDEYETFSSFFHEGLPTYYGITEHFTLPGIASDCIALCISDCTPKSPLALSGLSEQRILSIMIKTGELLSWLLSQGVLYTDLNPSNLLVEMGDDIPQVTLIDFTYCYYFLKNPNPSYGLRFSYQLDQSLKGQQLLIQELAFLLRELMAESPNQTFTDQIYAVLETGLHPAPALSLDSYLLLLKKLLV